MNWYKKAQLAEIIDTIDRPDLSQITPAQWQQINNRMIGLGYDFRGWEDTKKVYDRVNNTTGGLQDDHRKVLDSVLKNKEYIKEHSPQKIQGTFQKAIRYFGLTNNLKECGYILPNGTMLDFSGKNRGEEGGTRGLDHREISQIIPMPEFRSMGAIRHFPEQPGIEIYKQPTAKQLNVIWIDVNDSSNGYEIEIFDQRKGRTFQSYDPGIKASKVVEDIKRFYNSQM